jgi:hypothetical protein
MTSPQAAIAKHFDELHTAADRLRNKSPNANRAATLALQALKTAQTWLDIAANEIPRDPFKLADEDEASERAA